MALGLDYGDEEQSANGVNAYPCNKGMIIRDTDTSLGMTVSHPMLCNLLSPQSFEVMLTRSVHNTDLKGLTSSRNMDTSLSAVQITMNIGSVASDKGH